MDELKVSPHQELLGECKNQQDNATAMRLAASQMRTTTMAMREQADKMVADALFALVLVGARMAPETT
jgi:hypothetical protein